MTDPKSKSDEKPFTVESVSKAFSARETNRRASVTIPATFSARVTTTRPISVEYSSLRNSPEAWRPGVRRRAPIKTFSYEENGVLRKNRSADEMMSRNRSVGTAADVFTVDQVVALQESTEVTPLATSPTRSPTSDELSPPQSPPPSKKSAVRRKIMSVISPRKGTASVKKTQKSANNGTNKTTQQASTTATTATPATTSTTTTSSAPILSEKEAFKKPIEVLKLNEMEHWQSTYLSTTYELTVQSNGREDLLRFKDHFVGRSISTYPRILALGTREGDPICDMFSVRLYENRIVAALADGCGWGASAALAARTAVRTFNSYLKSRRHSLVGVRSAAVLVLEAFRAAQVDICRTKTESGEVGTTTLAGGVLLSVLEATNGTNEEIQIEPLKSEPKNDIPLALSPLRVSNEQPVVLLKYVFVFASVGDVKVFHYSKDDSTIADVTMGETKTAAKKFKSEDCGGRLGPQIPDETGAGIAPRADLRNLGVYAVPCREGDIIMMMSDGVADNLDPEVLGLEPVGGGLWADEAESERVAAKTQWRNSFLQTALVDSLFDLVAFTRHVLAFCQEKTRSSRRFMEQNPTKPLPQDYKTPDEATLKNMSRLNAFSAEQLRGLVSILFDFLQSKHTGDSFVSLIDAWGDENSEIVRAALSVFRQASRGNLSPTYLMADLKAFGIADDKAQSVAVLWKSSLAALKRSAVGHTMMVNELVDLEWNFGVTAANSDLNKVGDCFLQFKMSLDSGNGFVKKVPMELTLPQFYQMIAELEKARAHLESNS